jgi:hypothetical protein
MRMGDQPHAPAALPPEKRPGTHLQEVVWAPGPVWIGEKYLASTGIRSPYRQPLASRSILTL